MKQSKGIVLAVAFAIAVFLSIAGCTSMFTAKTNASYIVRVDGSKEITYSSDKEQIGLSAHSTYHENGKLKSVDLSVDKASTPDNAVAAAMQSQIKMLGIMEQLMQRAGPLAAGS